MRQTARLYCLTNPYMPGLVKIGFTRRSVYARMSELSFGGHGTSATGVPGAFILVKAWDVDHERAHAIEQQVHHGLRAHRVKAHRGRRAREFFHLSPEDAVAKVQVLLASLHIEPPAPRRAAPVPRPLAPDPLTGWPPRPAPKRNASAGPFLLLAFILLVVFLVLPH